MKKRAGLLFMFAAVAVTAIVFVVGATHSSKSVVTSAAGPIIPEARADSAEKASAMARPLPPPRFVVTNAESFDDLSKYSSLRIEQSYDQAAKREQAIEAVAARLKLDSNVVEKLKAWNTHSFELVRRIYSEPPKVPDDQGLRSMIYRHGDINLARSAAERRLLGQALWGRFDSLLGKAEAGYLDVVDDDGNFKKGPNSNAISNEPIVLRKHNPEFDKDFID